MHASFSILPLSMIMLGLTLRNCSLAPVYQRPAAQFLPSGMPVRSPQRRLLQGSAPRSRRLNGRISLLMTNCANSLTWLLPTIRALPSLTSDTATVLDYEEAFGLVEQARVDLERIQREFRLAINALQLLVGIAGVGPRLLQREHSEAVLVQDIAPGMPAELVTHRPDIRAAEYRLRAWNADIGAAHAAFFTRVSLTGFSGSSSAELSDSLNSGQKARSFTPKITLPIFSGGIVRISI